MLFVFLYITAVYKYCVCVAKADFVLWVQVRRPTTIPAGVTNAHTLPSHISMVWATPNYVYRDIGHLS